MTRYWRGSFICRETPKGEELLQYTATVDTESWGIGITYNRYPFEIRPFGEKKGGWMVHATILCFFFSLQWTRWKRVVK